MRLSVWGYATPASPRVRGAHPSPSPSPGTRGSPTGSHLDERSSAFFALGIARTTGRPVLVITTSGTAAAEFHPAIVEASYGRVPLIAITADRPFDLRGVGAPQTIDQQGLFGSAALWSHDMEATADADPSRVVSLAARLVSLAGGDPCGPVHLNLRFRRAPGPRSRCGARPGGGSANRPRSPRCGSCRDRLDRWPARREGRGARRRGAGRPAPARRGRRVRRRRRMAGRCRRPLRAACRAPRPGPGDRRRRSARLDRMAGPDEPGRRGALRGGAHLQAGVAVARGHRQVAQVFIEPAGWRDPTASATTIVRADPAATLAALAAALTEPVPDSWLERWRRADRLASAAIDASAGRDPVPQRAGGGAVAGEAASRTTRRCGWPRRCRCATSTRSSGRPARRCGSWPTGAPTASTGSSPPGWGRRRYREYRRPPRRRPVGAPRSHRPGHRRPPRHPGDRGGGTQRRRRHLPLPPPGRPSRHFERHWGTAARARLRRRGTCHRGGHRGDRRPDATRQAVGEPRRDPACCEVRTDRAANVALHRRIRGAVAAAVAEL